MKQQYDDHIGMEPSLPVDIINLLNMQLTNNNTHKHTEFTEPQNLLDEHELAMVV